MASPLAAVRRAHATPVPLTLAAMTGALVSASAETATAMVAVIAPTTPTAVAAITVAATATARAVGVGDLGLHQTIGVLRGIRPEDALR